MNGKNIFGKTVDQYAHLRVLKDKGLLQDHLNGMQSVYNKPMFVNDSIMVRDGTTGLQYVTNNMQYIMTEVEEVLYSAYTLPRKVPIISNIPRGASSYAYRVTDSVGEAGFIDSYGTNANSVSVSESLVSSVILQGGIVGKWSDIELEAAMYGGVPLDAATIDSATRACTNHIERVGLLGDASKGWTGLVNNPLIDIVNENVALQDSTDPVDVINSRISYIIEKTNEIFGNVVTIGMTVYLPIAQFNYLASKKYSADADRTMMSYLKESNPWTEYTGSAVVFEPLKELKGAGVGGKDRMLIGFNNVKVMEMANPISPYVSKIIEEPFSVQAPLRYSISPLNFKQPKACLYVDFAAPTELFKSSKAK